jgi:exosome complex component RRP4
MGLYDETSGRLVPLEGCYTPKLGDIVIGIVTEVKFAGYTLNIKSPYEGFLSTKDTRDELKLGNVVVARVKDVDEVKNVDLTDASRLEGGEILEISSMKVPRVIGKNSSMIRMIQDATRSEIIVGRNGRVWIRGGDSARAIEAILKIEREAHTPGLTDRISMLLKSGPTSPTASGGA